MSVTTRHTYQVLTKRPARMLAFFEWLFEQQNMAIWPVTNEDAGFWLANAVCEIGFQNPAIKALGWEPSRGKRAGYDNCGPGWPFKNVWLGVSVEDQAAADERIPLLLKCPAAVRWLSCEPLLGPVDLRFHIFSEPTGNFRTHSGKRQMELRRPADGGLHWVVAGGESGPDARPMHPDWARSLRDQCAAAGVPFFFKQWGEWAPYNRGNCDGEALATRNSLDLPLQRFGKKLSGRSLDGAEHNAYPEKAGA
jgi:protein gp37